MRIITGQARGCVLQTLTGDNTRPTAAKAKEGLFSAIQFELEGRQVLDLYAGCGQLGIEALSRGALGCVFVDKNPEAVAIIRRNLNEAARFSKDITKNAQVLATDVLSFLARTSDRFDVAFIDPPYAAGLLEPTLRAVVPHMNDGGVIVCESDEDAVMPDVVEPFSLARVYRYGRVHLWVYRRAEQEAQA